MLMVVAMLSVSPFVDGIQGRHVRLPGQGCQAWMKVALQPAVRNDAPGFGGIRRLRTFERWPCRHGGKVKLGRLKRESDACSFECG